MFHAKDFVKLSTVNLSTFSLIFFWKSLLHFDFYHLVPGVIFYLQLIGVKSIKQTYFHLHFATQHDAQLHFLLHVKTNNASKIGPNLRHYNKIKWIFIHNCSFSSPSAQIEQCHSHCAFVDFVSGTAWQVTYTWVSCIAFKNLKLYSTTSCMNKIREIRMHFINGNICTRSFEYLIKSLIIWNIIFTALNQCQGYFECTLSVSAGSIKCHIKFKFHPIWWYLDWF